MGHDTVLHPGRHRATNLLKIAARTIPAPPEGETLMVQLQSMEGINCGPPLVMPSSTDPEKLNLVLNALLSNEEDIKYTFYVDNREIANDLHVDVIVGLNKSTETTIIVQYIPQSLFRVRPVTRCFTTSGGHREAILAVSFSPNGKSLATGSGDCTVRTWDVLTGTPCQILSGLRTEK